MLDLSLFALVSVCASWSLVTAWSHNLSSNLVSSDPEFWPSHHDARKEGGNTGLAHTASAMRREPWHIVASTTLNNSATWVSYTHRSILYPTPVIRDTQHCVQWTQDEHIPMLHSSTNTTLYPNFFPRHFLWNTCNNSSESAQVPLNTTAKHYIHSCTIKQHLIQPTE